jgi:hypothetical protein
MGSGCWGKTEVFPDVPGVKKSEHVDQEEEEERETGEDDGKDND